MIGNLQALLVLVKGLPLAYNRDLQEDKERLFDSVDTVDVCLELAAPLVAGTKLNRAAIAEKLDRGLSRCDNVDGRADSPQHAATHCSRNRWQTGGKAMDTRLAA